MYVGLLASKPIGKVVKAVRVGGRSPGLARRGDDSDTTPATAGEHPRPRRPCQRAGSPPSAPPRSALASLARAMPTGEGRETLVHGDAVDQHHPPGGAYPGGPSAHP